MPPARVVLVPELELLLVVVVVMVGAMVPSAAATVPQGQLRRDQIACRYDEDCIFNAYCKEQKYCLCKENAFAYTLSNATIVCLQAATTLGDSCFLDEQCAINLSENSVCDKTEGCQCRPDAHFVDGRCYHTSRAGGYCRVSNECHINNPRVMLSCLYQRCVCPQQYRPINNGTDCIRTLELGQNCDIDEECITEGAVCKDVCHCTVHHEISQDGRHCLLAAEVLESSCKEDAQCAKYIAFSKCDSEKCACEEGYHYTSAKSKCWKDVGLNKHCSDSAECIVRSGNEQAALCSPAGRCQCTPGLTPTSDNSDCISRGAASIYSTFGMMFLLPLLLSLR